MIHPAIKTGSINRPNRSKGISSIAFDSLFGAFRQGVGEKAQVKPLEYGILNATIEALALPKMGSFPVFWTGSQASPTHMVAASPENSCGQLLLKWPGKGRFLRTGLRIHDFLRRYARLRGLTLLADNVTTRKPLDVHIGDRKACYSRTTTTLVPV